MGFFSYLFSYILPRNIFSIWSNTITSKQLSIEDRKQNTDPDIDVLLPQYDKLRVRTVYNEYIDDVVNRYNELEILLYRVPDYGISSMYMIQTLPTEELKKLSIPINITIKIDRVVIYCQEYRYEWYRDEGTITGHNNRIQFHFRRKPKFVNC